MDKGFFKVRPLEGGLDGWVGAGLPVEGEMLYAIRPGASAEDSPAP